MLFEIKPITYSLFFWLNPSAIVLGLILQMTVHCTYMFNILHQIYFSMIRIVLRFIQKLPFALLYCISFLYSTIVKCPYVFVTTVCDVANHSVTKVDSQSCHTYTWFDHSKYIAISLISIPRAA